MDQCLVCILPCLLPSSSSRGPSFVSCTGPYKFYGSTFPAPQNTLPPTQPNNTDLTCSRIIENRAIGRCNHVTYMIVQNGCPEEWHLGSSAGRMSLVQRWPYYSMGPALCMHATIPLQSIWQKHRMHATKETRKHRSKEGSRTTAASPPYGTLLSQTKPPNKFPTPA
jgi:hypothetical protein